MNLTLRSAAFNAGDMIDPHYTCDGEDVSPPLSWTGVPEGTKSLALICDDPDAPRGTWSHWVLYNIPPDKSELPEGVPPEGRLTWGAMQASRPIQGMPGAWTIEAATCADRSDGQSRPPQGDLRGSGERAR